MFFDSAYTRGGFWGFPISTTPHLAELLLFLNENGMKGEEFYGVGSWGAGGLDIYLAARMAWDPHLEVSAVLDDCYEKAYGEEAGHYVRQHHERLQSAMRAFALSKRGEVDDIGRTRFSKKEMIEPIYAGMKHEARPRIRRRAALAHSGCGPAWASL